MRNSWHLTSIDNFTHPSQRLLHSSNQLFRVQIELGLLTISTNDSLHHHQVTFECALPLRTNNIKRVIITYVT